MKSFLFVVFALVNFGFASDIVAAGSNTPETYLRPKGAVALNADKATDKPHLAVALRVRFIPTDANLVVAGQANGEIILWDVKDKKQLWRKAAFEKGLRDLEVAHDGKAVFATGMMGDLKILSTKNGDIISSEKIREGNYRFPMAMARLAPVFAYGNGDKNRNLSWRAYSITDDGIEWGERGDGSQKDAYFSFNVGASWDGKQVAMSNSYSDGQYIKRHTLDVFDVESSEMKVTISRDEEFNNLAFSPDGKLVAFWGGARDPRLLTIDLETKKINHEIHPDIDYVRRILFSPDGKLIYTTADMRPLEQGKSSPYLRVFEVATEKFLAVFAPSILPGVAGNVFTSDFDLSADGKRIALALRDSSDSDKDAAGLPDIVVFDAQ